MSQRKPSLKKGFTLIELLIVITIIGILAVALIPRIAQAPARARDVQRKADLGNIASALELYYSDNGFYPKKPSAVCVKTMTAEIGPYMPAGIVDDPSDLKAIGCATTGYGYVSDTDGTGYILDALLEVDTSTGDNYCSALSGTTADDVACTLFVSEGAVGPYYYQAR